MTTVLGARLETTRAIILPAGGQVDLVRVGWGALLHLARLSQPDGSAEARAEAVLLHVAGINAGPASRSRDERRRLARRERALRRIGTAVLGRHLAEHCGHTQAEAAANVSLIAGRITARQVGDWDRRLLRGAEMSLGAVLPGRFDQPRGHRLHDAAVGLEALDGEIRRAAELSPAPRLWLRAQIAEAEGTYQQVRDELFADFSRPPHERTPREHEKTAQLASEAAASASEAAASAREAAWPAQAPVTVRCIDPAALRQGGAVELGEPEPRRAAPPSP